MIKKIDGTGFIFDTERNEVGFVTINGKIHYRENFIRKCDGLLCCRFYKINENNRKHYITLPLAVMVCKYGNDMDLTDKIVYFNEVISTALTLNNIVVKDISEICDRWVIPSEFHGRYKLSSNGDIYDTINKILIFPPTNGGYFCLGCDGKHYTIHRLVYEYFIGDIPDGYVIDHKDNDILNNSYENLQLITQNENVKKERFGKALNRSRYLTYNGKRYFLNANYGVKYSDHELNLIYFNALSKAENKSIEECYCENQHIHFNFLTNKWCVHSFPTTNGHNADKSRLNAEFDTLCDAEKYFYDVCNEYGLVFLNKTEDAYEYYKSKGSINFRYLGYHYSISISNKLCKAANDFILKSFLAMPKEEFINNLSSFRDMQSSEIKSNKESERLEREEKYERMKKEWAEKKRLKESEIKERWAALEAMDCYEFNENSGTYSIFCYYKGKKYMFGVLSSFENAVKINELIKSEPYKENAFSEWFSYFKENIFQTFRDKEVSEMRLRLREDSKGYDWFAPKNCWRSKIKHNGKTYTLGYFKNKECCELIYKEALSTISVGKFEKWFEGIKEHRSRIKSICY